MPITKEQFNSLPDFIKPDYVANGEEYVPALQTKVADIESSFAEKEKALSANITEMANKIAEFEKTKTAEIEAAKAKALEEAKGKGDIGEIEKRYQEQMTDMEKRIAEATRAEVSKEFELKNLRQSAASMITEMTSSFKPLDDQAARIIKSVF